MRCTHCQRKDQQVKNGTNPFGSQRYRCQVCRWTYTPQPKAIGSETAIREQAVRMYVDGINLRRIGRIKVDGFVKTRKCPFVR